MARWNIERAVEVAELLEREDHTTWRRLSRRLGLRDAELRHWREMAARIADGFDAETRLYEQFAGFFGLEDLRVAELMERPATADVALGRERTAGAQIVKQADVLMLALMLPDLMPPDVLEANYRYYEPRTAHGSSLSPPVHALLAARCGRPHEALEYLRMSARVDLGGVAGSSAYGVHMATLGGTWQAAVLGLGGAWPSREGLRIDPRLPRAWDRLRYPIRWRGARVRVEVSHEELAVETDAMLDLAVGDAPHRRVGAGRYLARRVGDGWSAAAPLPQEAASYQTAPRPSL